VRNVYFLQVGYAMGCNAYIPYTCGCLAAYAWRNPVIDASYRDCGCFFRRDPIDDTLARMKAPKVVAFSCCAWNFEYNKSLAVAVKECWPDCFVIFGGHQILNGSAEQMNHCDAIDCLIHGAGEIIFERLLLALLDSEADFMSIPAISYRALDGTVYRNPNPAPRCPEENLPSPYLDGRFDVLLEQYGDVRFSATLETNRGCPYRCAFCDWGGDLRGLREIPMKRVLAEIEWFAKRKIEVVFCADSNFGILPRDEEIADAFVRVKEKYGYPRKLIATYDKGSGDITFRINEKLLKAGLSAGATLAFQSADPAVLNHIGRKNLSIDQYRDVMMRYNEKGIPAYAEFIVGLPGETYKSFTGGIDRVLGGGLCASIEAFPCEVLPNTAMSDSEYILRNGLRLIRLRRTQRHQSRPSAGDIPEYATIVVGTSAMPREDWVRTLLFTDVIQAFHGCRLLTLTAIFLNVTYGTAFSVFYEGLIDFAGEYPDTLLGEQLKRFRARIDAFSLGDGEQILLYDPMFGDIMYPLAEALFLCCAAQADRFFGELPLFLRRWKMDREIEKELIAWQRLIAVLPYPPQEKSGAVNRRFTFKYDWNAFFIDYYLGGPASLRVRPNALMLTQDTVRHPLPDFAREIVWYGRKKGELIRKDYSVLYD